jgi:hypothetical protein
MPYDKHRAALFARLAKIEKAAAGLIDSKFPGAIVCETRSKIEARHADIGPETVVIVQGLDVMRAYLNAHVATAEPVPVTPELSEQRNE